MGRASSLSPRSVLGPLDRVELPPVVLGEAGDALAGVRLLPPGLHASAHAIQLVPERQKAVEEGAGDVWRAISLAGEVAQNFRQPATVLRAVAIKRKCLLLKFPPLLVIRGIVISSLELRFQPVKPRAYVSLIVFAYKLGRGYAPSVDEGRRQGLR
jgi:hypothetical protein